MSNKKKLRTITAKALGGYDHIREIFNKKLGNLSAVAKELGICRNTLYRLINDDKGLNEIYLETTESSLDFVENKLMAKINDNDITAIIFYLKTKGKKRGYIEKQEVEVTKKEDIDLAKLTTEELNQLRKLQAKAQGEQ